MATLGSTVTPFGFNDVVDEISVLSKLYFKDTMFYERAVDERTSLIVGRRGSGKTALGYALQYTKARHGGTFPIYVDVDEPEVFAEILSRVADHLRNASSRQLVDSIAKLWTIALWHALMAEVAKEDGIGNKNGALKLQGYLRRQTIAGMTASRIIQRIFDIVLSAIGVRHTGADGVLHEVERLLSNMEFVECKDFVTRYLDEARRRAVIVIDTLEEYKIYDRSIQNCLAGLLHAVTTLSLGKMHTRVAIKCFLPAEIVQTLQETVVLNVGKTFPNALYMHWRRKDLLRLLSWRLQYFVNSDPELSSLISTRLRTESVDWSDHNEVRTKIWDMYFPPPRTVRGRIIHSFEYISIFTQLRPRQFIWVCNNIARSAHNAGRFPLITWDDVTQGVVASVPHLVTEVLNSFKDVYPQAGAILQTALTGAPPMLEYGEVERLAHRTSGEWREDFDYSIARFWRLALETGCLGIMRPSSEKMQYDEAQFEYVVAERLHPAVGDKLAIHPMFYSRLRTELAEGAKVVRPIGPEDLYMDDPLA